MFLFLTLTFQCFGAAKNEKRKTPQSIRELQQQIEGILTETHTPAASIAIVHRGGPEWIAGLGKADVASGRDATPETLFRIGSISKGFVALAILLLADQGKLSLNDPVHNLAPEVRFENRWEASDPVRIVHLLEHTTGWDDMRLREYAKDAPSMGLRQALDYDPHSRVSRWPPGTRAAYCNSGPAVAAYIVEKVTHQRFEDFVEQNLFLPIGMKTATYFQPSPETATTLYHMDGKNPYRYWNALYRPSGSINASAKDMANYVQFYLNRGLVNRNHIVPSIDIDRMEIPESTWAAQQGMTTGYGLGNFSSIYDGFVYHGHNGGVEGGLSEMAYVPEFGVGYFFSINTNNAGTFGRIGEAIRDYVSRDLQRSPLPRVAALPSNFADYVGWYQPDSPRIEAIRFLTRVRGIAAVRFKDGQLLLSQWGRKSEIFVPEVGAQFRNVPRQGPPATVPTLELLRPEQEGRFIQVGAMSTMKRIPAWIALLEIAATTFVLLSMASILAYAPFWILGGISKQGRRPAERGMRAWPFAAVLSSIAMISILIACREDLISRLGNLTVWSGALCLASIMFAAAAIASALCVWRSPVREVRRSVRAYSMAVTVALLIAVAYLAYWGIIGLRTWV